MRREGYELQVGQPQVIFKEIDGVKCEPIEELTINVPEEYASKMIDMVTRRKGEMVKMESAGERVNLEFDMPSRGIIGLRTNVLTASAGEAIMAHQPIEELTINVPEEYASKMIDMVTRRKGEMVKMESAGERVNLEFDMPSRGIIGLRTNVLTASAGEAIMAHRFKEYQPYKGEIERRTNGSMIAMESGTAFAYAIDKLQDRGKFFIFPQEEVYAGQVVGEHSHDNDLVINVTKSKKLTNMRAQEEVYAGQVVGEHSHDNDLVINVTKSKKLTNMRASGSDDKARLIPPVQFSLEEALEYIKEDEYVEVTPKSMRMRKVILDELERKRANKN